MKMPWVKPQQTDPEPPKQNWICVDAQTDELKILVNECTKAGLPYEIREDNNGTFQMYFYKEDQAAIQQILDQPRPAPKKTSLDSQIYSACSRAQSSDDYLTCGVVTAKKTPQPRSVDAPPHPMAPTEIEKQWVIEKSIEELAERLQDTAAETQSVDIVPSSDDKTGRNQRKKRKSMGRTNQIKTRLTDAELVQFQRRVKKSGLSQGDYLRSAALNGEIRIEERSMADIALLDELALIRAELGRQGGLLKLIIKPNEGRRELAPAEWKDLIGTIREMEKLRNQIAEIGVKIQRGHS